MEKKLRHRHHKNYETDPCLEPVEPRPHSQNIFPYDHIFQVTVAQLVKKKSRVVSNSEVSFSSSQQPVAALHSDPNKSSPSYFFKIQCNTTLSSTSTSSKKSFSFRFAYHTLVGTSLIPHADHFPCPSHPPSFDHPNISQRASISDILVMKFSNRL
jgi:hypothetical protein